MTPPMDEPIDARLIGANPDQLLAIAHAMRNGTPLTIPRLRAPYKGRKQPAPGEAWEHLLRFQITGISNQDGGRSPSPASSTTPTDTAPPATTHRRELHRQTWHPLRPGDVVLVQPDHTGYGATYAAVESPAGPDRRDGSARLILLTAATHDDDAGGITPDIEPIDLDTLTGQTPPVAARTSTLFDLWFDRQIGPRRLTIVRAGRVVHDGPGRHP
ncbi:hypothetical protein GCM10012275_57350 [Longimycelium tulufanense]|uniref:Uncharacterized protein n=1 Tax=Longimycelium tulufanense TaxID=907463 RepID=A0A8J3CDQ8_9PSEU|nr:hypothetical protein [Longimycelium tulufanense]GGM79315.1 hypothetical protein GCM10012275_57350 [Longimycelium tulufanense]